MKKHFCILGSGFGGGIIANELSKNENFKVTLVDLYKIEQNVDNLNDNKIPVNDKLNSFNHTNWRSLGFGGTSNLWHGVLTLFDAIDWENINNFTKINYKNEYYSNLSNDYLKLNKYKNFNVNNYDEINQYLIESNQYITKKFLVQKKPIRIINYLKNNKKINFLEESNAIKILENNDKNTKVLIEKNNKQIELDCEVLIICMGTIETTRFLIQSYNHLNIEYKKYDLGKNLRDHPWAVMGYVRKRNNKKFLYNINDFNIDKDMYHRIGYINKDNKSNNCFRFRPSIQKDYIDFKNQIKSFSIFSLLKNKNLFNHIFNIFLEKFFKKIIVDKIEIIAYLDQCLDNKSYIEINKKENNDLRIRPDVYYEIAKDEIHNIKILKSNLFNILSKKYTIENLPLEKNSFENAFHFYGTLRFGTNNSKAILNNNLSIKNLKNAYVCDLSIFPHTGNSNPTLELINFSLLLQNHLKKVYS